jgi:thioesterase domain-containing protein
MINYPELDEMTASAFDFNAIVDACINQIRAAGCDAPILLAGYCFGGCVAFETAQRLLRSHYRVAFLGLIDTPLGRVMRRSRIIHGRQFQDIYRPCDPNALSKTF